MVPKINDYRKFIEVEKAMTFVISREEAFFADAVSGLIGTVRTFEIDLIFFDGSSTLNALEIPFFYFQLNLLFSHIFENALEE